MNFLTTSVAIKRQTLRVGEIVNLFSKKVCRWLFLSIDHQLSIVTVTLIMTCNSDLTFNNDPASGP